MVAGAAMGSEGAAGVVLWVVVVWAEKRQRGMQKEAAARTDSAGGHEEEGSAVSGHQDVAPERVLAVAIRVGGR